MNFINLILRKIIKIAAIRCRVLKLKCTKFNFGWGSAPDPAGVSYSAPLDPLTGFSNWKGKGGERRKETILTLAFSQFDTLRKIVPILLPLLTLCVQSTAAKIIINLLAVVKMCYEIPVTYEQILIVVLF